MRTCLQCGDKTTEPFCARDGTATIVECRLGPAHRLQPGAVFAGRYRIVAELGRGGMGEVYAAQHTGTGQPVAIKTLALDPEDDPESTRRFFHEARVTAGLQHPNTIRVFDFGQADDGVCYIAMERLRGETLADRVRTLARQNAVLGEDAATELAIAILRSLDEAHRAGLVHRDLKPANIFLHRIGTETVVKVLDFGIAKCDAGLTRSGTTVGTPSYMSPEQVLNQAVDGRADLYALGIILYGSVSGQLPFAGESAYAVMMKHVEAPVPELRSRLRAPTSVEYVDIVQRALAKHPADRFRDAAEMRHALEQAVAHRAAGQAHVLAAVSVVVDDILADPTLAASSVAITTPAVAWRQRRKLIAAAALVALGGAAGVVSFLGGTAEVSSAAAVPARPAAVALPQVDNPPYETQVPSVQVLDRAWDHVRRSFARPAVAPVACPPVPPGGAVEARLPAASASPARRANPGDSVPAASRPSGVRADGARHGEARIGAGDEKTRKSKASGVRRARGAPRQGGVHVPKPFD